MKVIRFLFVLLFFAAGFAAGIHFANDWDAGYRAGWYEARNHINSNKWVIAGAGANVRLKR